MIVVGTHLICKLTLWLYVKQLHKQVPHTGNVICEVTIVDTTKVNTGAPPNIYVDCTKSIGWLKTSHPKKFWTRYDKDNCYE